MLILVLIDTNQSIQIAAINFSMAKCTELVGQLQYGELISCQQGQIFRSNWECQRQIEK